MFYVLRFLIKLFGKYIDKFDEYVLYCGDCELYYICNYHGAEAVTVVRHEEVLYDKVVA